MIHIRPLLLLCFLLHFHGIICQNNKNTDRDVLLSFKHQVTDPNKALSSWTEDSNQCTSWYGVNCSKVGNEYRVQSLSLSGLGLFGKLPSNLSNLTYLNSLDISENTFRGHIPPQFSHLSFLNLLQLAFNNLTGTIPQQLGQLHLLQTLDLSVNNLTGIIPSSFGNLSSLNYLALARNSFVGEIPSELGNLHNLSTLQLSENSLSGEFPTSIFNLSSLFFLSEEIFQLSSLRTLYLQGNSLNGSLPPEFFNMEQLETMNVSNNQLTGNIPETINGFSSLKSLAMARNKFIGVIPNNIGDLTSLETLDLSSNNLTGQIPQSLEKLKHIVRLNLSFNNLEGEVPMKGVFMNPSQVDLHGNSKLCGTSIEIMHNLGVIMCVAGNKKRSILLPIILGVTGAIVLSISMIYLLCVLIIQKKKLKEEKATLVSAQIRGLPQNISYGDIRLATNNFADENLVGKGGFGTVYKGVFTTSTGETSTLAVKVLDLKQSKVLAPAWITREMSLRPLLCNSCPVVLWR